MSSLFQTIRSLEGSKISDRHINDEYLPSNIRLEQTEFQVWNELCSSPDARLIKSQIQKHENFLLLRLIMYSEYTQTAETNVEKSLVLEMIDRIRMGPNSRSTDLLDQLNKMTNSSVSDWFHVDKILNKVSWNPQLPHPFIDLLQKNYLIKDQQLFGDPSFTVWVRFGYIPFIKLNFEQYSSRLCIRSAEFGNLHVLKWARENGCPWDEATTAFASRKGHLEVLKWARENGCPWDESVCIDAAHEGHLEVLKWARENGCPWNENVCINAARGDQLEVLKWARENGCPWNDEVCATAATNGNLDMLKWARENGCPWDEWTCIFAYKYGHLEVLEWARKNGCPWDESE